MSDALYCSLSEVNEPLNPAPIVVLKPGPPQMPQEELPMPWAREGFGLVVLSSNTLPIGGDRPGKWKSPRRTRLYILEIC